MSQLEPNPHPHPHPSPALALALALALTLTLTLTPTLTRCAVTLQNAGYALVRRYSRGYLHEKYSASSALFVMEMAKLLLSAVVRHGGLQP